MRAGAIERACAGLQPVAQAGIRLVLEERAGRVQQLGRPHRGQTWACALGENRRGDGREAHREWVPRSGDSQASAVANLFL